MASIAELQDALQNAHAAGDTKAATALADEIVRMRNVPAPQLNPASQADFPEATPTNNFLAGLGKAISDAQRGAYQVGLGPQDSPFNLARYFDGRYAASQKQQDQVTKQDAPLLKTGAGVAGNLTGNAITSLPFAVMPGVNALPGAALAGGLYGYLQPTGTNDSRLLNTGEGSALFGAVPILKAAVGGVKSLIQPMFQGGREAVVGNTLNRFAGNDAATMAALQNPKQFVPNSMPTAAEATMNPGLAMLEGGAQTRTPEAKAAFTQRQNANTAARADALRTVAGDPGQMDFYTANRDATAKDLYAKAFAETPDDSPWIKGQVTQLMKRPAFVDALKQGQETALNLGIPVDPTMPEHAPQILHYTKLALDDAISKEIASGGSAAGLQDTQRKLVSLMESKGFSPSYREARDTFKQMSAPINQMEVGQYLYNKAVPALNDYGGTARTRAQAFADAMRNADATAAKATGFPGAKMDSVMSPDQMATLNGVAQDLSRRAAVEDMMRGIGSNTAQNLATHNIMSQIAGPLGLPSSVSEKLMGTLLTTPYLGGILEFGAKSGEAALQRELANTLLDPIRAADLMKRARAAQMPGLLGQASRYLPSAGVPLLGSYAGQ